MNKKVIVIIGIVIAIAGISEKSLLTILVGIIIVAGGHFYFKPGPNRSNRVGFNNDGQVIKGGPLFNTYVTGMGYEGREHMLKKYLGPAYFGKSMKEIEKYLQTHDRMYEYPITKIPVTLVPEPSNEYDPNAISIMLDGKHKIGYVPSEETVKVKKLLKKRIEAEVSGSNFYWIGSDNQVFKADKAFRINLSFYDK